MGIGKKNGGSFCLRERMDVSLAGRVLLDSAVRELCSACSLSQGRWSAASWSMVRFLNERDAFSVTEIEGHNDFCV